MNSSSIIDSGGKIVDASKFIAWLSLKIGEFFSGLTDWVSRFSLFEVLLILFIVVVGVLLLFLRAKLKKDRVRRRYFN